MFTVESTDAHERTNCVFSVPISLKSTPIATIGLKTILDPSSLVLSLLCFLDFYIEAEGILQDGGRATVAMEWNKLGGEAARPL